MNLFNSLENLKGERYVSASFAVLLNEIPGLTSFLLNKWFNTDIELGDYEVITEEQLIDGATGKKIGFIDISIKSLSINVYIENKVDSGLSEDKDAELKEKQLPKYYNHIKQLSSKSKLVFITKDYIDDETALDYTDKHVFWTQVYEDIEEFYKNNSNEKENFLIKHFLEFLGGKGMSYEKVNWQYVEGVKSFFNLLDILGNVMDELKKDKKIIRYGKKSIGQDFSGFSFDIFDKDKQKDFWIGVCYSDIEKIYLELTPYFQDKHKGFDFTRFKQSPYPSAYEFDFQKKYFYMLSKEEQKKALRGFIEERIEVIKSKFGE